MKNLAIVLSAAVVIGLAVYAGFSSANLMRALGDTVAMRIDAFVAMFACLCIGSSALALGFRAAIARADRSMLQSLEHRLAKLEQSDGTN